MGYGFLRASGWGCLQRHFGVLGVFVAFAFFLQSRAAPTDDEIAPLPGMVAGKVLCGVDPSQNYALYLPSTYTTERKWPVLYCFDPAARGRVPVERFRAGAEKFGYILAGSNNSNNDGWGDNAKIIAALFQDTSERWSIDRTRIYVCGFSGGARVASQLGLSGRVCGVIACGGGFPQGGRVRKSVPCLYLGIAGVDDFNYCELKKVDRALEGNAFPHRFMSFCGGHDWPSVETATDALEWLEIQSMRTGLCPVDLALVEASHRRRAEALQQMRVGERWFEIRALIADFRGMAEVSALENVEKTLAAMREVRDWEKEERILDWRQTIAVEELQEQPSPAAIKMWRRKAILAEDGAERRLARRVVSGVFIISYYYAREAIDQGEYEQAINALNLAIAMDPSRESAYFELARAHGLENNKKAGLAALREAAAHGFKGIAKLDREPAFAVLRKEVAFEEIRQAVLKNRSKD